LNDPCGRLACGPGWCRTRENSVALRDLEFWLVWRGKGWMKTRDREFVLFPGFCALMRPGGIYDAGHDEAQPLGITYIHFDMLPVAARKASRSWPEFFELEDYAYFEVVSRRVVELFGRRPETASALFRGLLMDLLARPAWKRPEEGGRFAQPHRREILAMVSALRSGSPEDLPTVSGMAERLHLSSEHFSRLFRQVAGQSPMAFLLEVRMSQARHLLRETSLGVGEIAERLGYRDVFFFSRQFKQKTGVPPLAYRRHGGGLVL
jgi:AraC-like DNA-binding protein